MKKLLFISCLCLLIVSGCKKEDSKKSKVFEVSYNFYMDGATSDITYTSISEGKTITLKGVTSPPKTGPTTYPPYKIRDFVKPGDHVKLEMTTSPKTVGYTITISYIKDLGNGQTNSYGVGPGSSKSNGTNSTTAVLERTFTEADFNY